MMHRIQKKHWLTFGLSLLIIIEFAILAMLWNQRVDMTRNDVYTLSDVTINTLDKLQDRMNVKFFFSKEIPPQYTNVRDYTRDLLNDLASRSHGQLHVEFIEIGDEEKLKELAEQYEVPPAQVQVLNNDKFEAMMIYMGMAILYGGKQESIPFFESTQGLEYQFTTAARRLVSEARTKVAYYEPKTPEMLLRAYIEPQLRNQYALYARRMNQAQLRQMEQQIVEETQKQIDQLKQQMQFNPDARNQIMSQVDPAWPVKSGIEDLYELVETDLQSPLNRDVGVLVIPELQDTLTSGQLRNIDQFVMDRGKLMVFVDKMEMDQQTGELSPNDKGLIEQLESWGIFFQPGLVLDDDCLHTTKHQIVGRQIRQVQEPHYPAFWGRNVNRENPITKGLTDPIIYYASSVDESRLPEGVTMTPLLMSSEQSAQTTDTSLQTLQRRYGDGLIPKDGPHTVGALFEGRFRSGFKPTAGDADSLLTEVDNGSILVVTGAQFLTDPVRSQSQGTSDNRTFFNNALDYLSGNGELITLRGKGSKPGVIDVEPFLSEQDSVNVDSRDPVQRREAEEKMKEMRKDRIDEEIFVKQLFKVFIVALPVALLLLVALLRYLSVKRKRMNLRRRYE